MPVRCCLFCCASRPQAYHIRHKHQRHTKQRYLLKHQESAHLLIPIQRTTSYKTKTPNHGRKHRDSRPPDLRTHPELTSTPPITNRYAFRRKENPPRAVCSKNQHSHKSTPKIKHPLHIHPLHPHLIYITTTKPQRPLYRTLTAKQTPNNHQQQKITFYRYTTHQIQKSSYKTTQQPHQHHHNNTINHTLSPTNQITFSPNTHTQSLQHLLQNTTQQPHPLTYTQATLIPANPHKPNHLQLLTHTSHNNNLRMTHAPRTRSPSTPRNLDPIVAHNPSCSRP